MIPVKRHSGHSAWAVYRNNGYEFEADDSLSEKINNGITTPYFEMDDGHPIAIRFQDRPDKTDPK